MVEKDNKFGFGVNDCPLWLFKELSSQAKSRYNNQYWTVILDWYRKAEAYDMLVSGQIYQQEPMIEPQIQTEKEQEPKQEVKLFGRKTEKGD